MINLLSVLSRAGDFPEVQAMHTFSSNRSTKMKSQSQATPKSEVQNDPLIRFFSYLQFLSVIAHLNDLVNALIFWQRQIVFLLNIGTHKSDQI
jgi:hypothetical protein